MLFAVSVTAAAHPHADIDQQALLSLGLTKASLTFRIVPSTEDGAHMFDHLDTNGDASLSPQEEAAFAAELLSRTVLSVDGMPVELRLMNLSLPGRTDMSSGLGVIEVQALTGLSIDPAEEHDVRLEVTYDRFAEDWFLQPFYYSDLVEAGMPYLKRTADSSAIDILISGH